MVTSEVGKKSGVEVSEDGKCMLTAESGEEGIKIFSRLDDDDRVTEDRCRGILKIWCFCSGKLQRGGLHRTRCDRYICGGQSLIQLRQCR